MTNAARVRDAAAARLCNAVLIKPNQAGTLTETRAALAAAREVEWRRSSRRGRASRRM